MTQMHRDESLQEVLRLTHTLDAYVAPYEWLYDNTPLKGSLAKYDLWWDERFGH